MKIRSLFSWMPGLLLCSLMLLLLSCNEDNVSTTPVVNNVPTDTLNIDVVLPQTIRESWQNAINWAMENIKEAQQLRQNRVMLRLRYHDEYGEDLDSLAYRLANPQEGDDTCHAIIGPYHSDNAQTFLSYAARTRLPVVMPTCTSAELQRTNIRNNYAWFLTESDITECEIMLSAAHAMKASDVLLVYEDNTYGRSFYEWFGYYATELGMHIAGDGAIAYEKGMDLKPFIRKARADAVGSITTVLVAVSSATDYEKIINDIEYFCFSWNLEGEEYIDYSIICADTSLDELIADPDHFNSFDHGISPYGDMHFGFPQDYEVRYGRKPLNGEAQIYDALMIIALGAAQRMSNPTICMVDGKPAVSDTEQPLLTDYMRSVVSSEQGMTIQWNLPGMANAFRELESGHSIDLSGATGQLIFDETSRTQILNTTYMLWTLDWHYIDDNTPTAIVEPILYLSTAGIGYATNTSVLWKAEKNASQRFSSDVESHELPPVSEHWAVIVSPSTTWDNYRHQADAFAMYQLLRQYGYDDYHIVLIVEDNLAGNPKNVFPGQIFTERSPDPENEGKFVNEDVRYGAVVDYHFSDLRPEDLGDILLGRESARLPHVIHPDSASNVFVFWSGHGGMLDGPLWGNETAKEYFGTKRIRDVIAQMDADNMYRRMMLTVETCYSGKWGEVLIGLPDVLVFTAANTYETSKADVFDQQLGVFLSNAFARNFRSQVGTSSDITLYDLYRELYRTTNGSHVMIYNNNEYGSVYDETMAEFFPR